MLKKFWENANKIKEKPTINSKKDSKTLDKAKTK
jgi:hypothetical protein